jgi:DNA-binding NarL/FixJ family response regulator
MHPVRVAVLDRRPLVREVLASKLATERSVEVVLVAADAKDPAAPAHTPEVVLLGAADPPPAAWSARIVPFTDQVSATDLVDVVCGRTRSGSRDQRVTPAVELTAREKHVLGGVAEGLRSHEIAATMCITRKSVENHKQRIFAKLGVQSQAHAVAVALEIGPLPRVNRRTERTG